MYNPNVIPIIGFSHGVKTRVCQFPHPNLFNSISLKSLALEVRGQYMSMEPSDLQVRTISKTWTYTKRFPHSIAQEICSKSTSCHHNRANSHTQWKHGKDFFQIASFEDETYFKGEGCNGPALIFILITLNPLSCKLITLGPTFQFSIFSFQFSLFFTQICIIAGWIGRMTSKMNFWLLIK